MKMQEIEKVQDGLEAAMSTLREIEGKSNGVSGSFADTMRKVGAGLDAIRWERQERTNRLRSLILKAYELILDGAGSDTLDTAEKASGVDWRETWREVSRADPLGRLETSREYDDLETDLEALTAAIEDALDEEAAEAGPATGNPEDLIDSIAAAALKAEEALGKVREWMKMKAERGITSSPTPPVALRVFAAVDEILERTQAYRREARGAVLYDRVRITDGPGKGKTGTIVRDRGDGRLEVATEPKSEGRQAGRVAVFSRNVRRLESAADPEDLGEAYEARGVALLGLEARVRTAEAKVDDAADFLEDLEPKSGGWIDPDDLEGLKAILGRKAGA